MGDWISFWLGWRFKKPLHRWSFLKKNKALLDKTEHALHQHSMFTILVGRFVGPTRPLVPMVAGMLISRWQNLLRRILSAACCGHRFTSCRGFWRVRRSIFLPGCRAVSLNGCCWQQRCFCGLEAGCAGGYGAAVKRLDRLSHYLSRGRLLWLTPLISAIGVVALVVLIRHPLMPVYIDILRKVVGV